MYSKPLRVAQETISNCELDMTTELAVSKRERKLARAMMIALPGLGKTGLEQAKLMADSDLTTTESIALIEAMYVPSESNKGAATKVKWLSQAIRERYGNRLSKISGNIVAFKSFLGEMEAIIAMREQINEQFSFSFHEAMMLDEIGETAKSIGALVDDCGGGVRAKMRIMEGVRRVKSGQFATLEAALFQGSREFSSMDDYDE